MTLPPLRSLAEVATIEMGQAPPGSACNKNRQGVPLVKAGEFGGHRPVIREWTIAPRKYAKEGDVLICVVGATCGKVNLGIDCAIGRSVAAIRPGDELDQSYLYYWLLAREPASRHDSRGSAQGVLSKKYLGHLRLPVPSRADQRLSVKRIQEQLTRIEAGLNYVAEAEMRLHALRRSRLDQSLHANGSSLATFDSIFVRAPTPATVVEARNYQSTGNWPVIDQGAPDTQVFTDEEGAVYNGPLPVIIFGDHTRRVKIAYEPFAVGAQGTKLLLPREGVNARFAYYAMQAVEIPARGYGRHYGLLRSSRFRTGGPDFQAALIQEQDRFSDSCNRLMLQFAGVRSKSAALRRAVFAAEFRSGQEGASRVSTSQRTSGDGHLEEQA